MNISSTAPVISPAPGELDRLKNEQPENIAQEKARLKKATEEFESFFMYYMLKTMRSSATIGGETNKPLLGGSMGKEMFQDMFDMEVASKVTNHDGRSISEMLYASLEKLIDAKSDPKDALEGMIKIPEQIKKQFDFENEKNRIELNTKKFIERPVGQNGLPINRSVTSAANRSPVYEKYKKYIDEASERTNLDSALIASVIQAESGGDAKAVSHVGAKGLMQIIDSTANELGVTDPFDPQENILAGSRYLKRMLDRFGDLDLALAAYNSGPGNVAKYGGIPPFPETEKYIERVTDTLKTITHNPLNGEPKVQSSGVDK